MDLFKSFKVVAGFKYLGYEICCGMVIEVGIHVMGEK